MKAIPWLDLRALLAPEREALEDAALRVVRSGRYVLGPELEAFEAEWAAACGTAHAVGVSSGLAALELLLRALDLPEKALVAVPGHTFVATWTAVRRAGLTPLPVDVCPQTGNIDPGKVLEALNQGALAVVAVHLHGLPCDMDALIQACSSRGAILIEDAAQAHGARWRGRVAGSIGRAAAFSFYPGKNLGALGDAGAVTTDDAVLAERVKLMRNYGSRIKYRHEVDGGNDRLDEIQAAFLRVRLAGLPTSQIRRHALATQVLEQLSGLPGLSLPEVSRDTVPAWHLFAVRHARRDDLAAFLASRGVGTMVHYPVPPHRQEAFSEFATHHLPVTEAWCATTLSLPLHPALHDEEVQTIIEAVRAFF